MAEPALALVDTNVVVYAHDAADPAKHHAAATLLRSLSDAGTLAYSTQVFNEFCAVVMRAKRERPLTPAEARLIVSDLAATGVVLTLSGDTTSEALTAMELYGISFWDGLVWATAKEHGVDTIYTEDTPAMPIIDGVRYVNPFEA